VAVNYTRQDVINAYAAVLGQHYIEAIKRGGLAFILEPGPGRKEKYAGQPLRDLPVPVAGAREEIATLLETKTSDELKPMATAALRDPATPRPPLREPKGLVIGMHGAPGTAAPRPDTWDLWLNLLRDMGVRWYKQCDDGSADTGPNSIFRWVLRLRDAGIVPIVRYLKSNQFPNRVPAHYFEKMQRFAAEGVTWAEIGNEPNLRWEWEGDWQERLDHNDPAFIQAIAEAWLADAEAALAAGVRPAFYAFGPTDWRLADTDQPPTWSSVMFVRKVAQYLAQNHHDRARAVFERGGWVAVHMATYEQPVDFNPFRQGRNAWDVTLRGYEVVLDALETNLQVDRATLVIMSTEGGVFTPDSSSMNGHERLPDEEAHARRALEMFDWVEAYSPLQAMCPWCLSVGSMIGHFDESFKNDGWVRQDGDNLTLLPAVRALIDLRASRPA
jgi:hypothetical protein